MKESLLNRLRDRNLSIENFRKTSLSLSQLIAYDIFLTMRSEEVALIAILRSGLAMLLAFQEIFIGSPIGLIGIRRDEKTAAPHLYYEKLPSLSSSTAVLILDPMLATGGSANLALNLLKSQGALRLMLVSIISAPEGAALIQKNHPDVSVYTVSMDLGLDAQKYIVPGLGDFGDRYFGTI